MVWHGFNGLIYSKSPLLKLFFRMYLKLSGSDIPSCCKIGKNVQFPHGIKGIILKKGSILCAGAKIICNRGLLVVGENTVVGANAVLTCSTGDNEIRGAYLLKN